MPSIALLASLLMCIGCNDNIAQDTIVIQSVTNQDFDHNGGFGTAVIAAMGGEFQLNLLLLNGFV